MGWQLVVNDGTGATPLTELEVAFAIACSGLLTYRSGPIARCRGQARQDKRRLRR